MILADTNICQRYIVNYCIICQQSAANGRAIFKGTSWMAMPLHQIVISITTENILLEPGLKLNGSTY